ncbi:MAG: GAF domain-containing protein [Prochloron sp. SP5CPC1]|nr:GAF domain-containing protein [Candidatus Paraprochloron terpiosi SP5CPC1]
MDIANSFQQPAELIEELLEIGKALSSVQNLDKLLNLILSKSREITCSDAGSVYLLDKNGAIPCLLFKVAQNDSLPHVSFKEFAVQITKKSLAGYVALTGETLNIPDAYNIPSHLPYQLDRSFDRDFFYRTCSVLVLPMQNQEGEVIGVLQLINRKRKPEDRIRLENAQDITVPYSLPEESILRSLASQAAISLERNILQDSIENLFEGFVRASIQTIEARDPTTSGHSERVAALTVRLAQEVNTISTGSLQSIQFSDHQLQEIRYAALLHDFGKVSVPEAILNKHQKLYPSKLEIIRQRFAFAKRTREMECAQEKYSYLVEHPSHRHDSPHCQKLIELDQQLERSVQELDRYWELVQKANEPLAYKSKKLQSNVEQMLAQLTAISKYTYRDIDGQLKPLITSEEIKQLTVPLGNLTTEERLAIEAHVTHSYEFLKQIPWTKHLQDVPMIAYGHHEKIDGSGSVILGPSNYDPCGCLRSVQSLENSHMLRQLRTKSIQNTPSAGESSSL